MSWFARLAALVLLAHLVDQARALQAELDEIL